MKLLHGALVPTMLLALLWTSQGRAEAVASINLYVMPQSVVCHGGNYEDGCDGTIKADAFPGLLSQAKKLMKSKKPERGVLSIDKDKIIFPPGLIIDSRTDDRYKQQYSIVLEVSWKRIDPKSISIQRFNDITDELFFPKVGRNPYHRDLPIGKFYYHFSFSQIYRLRMDVKTGAPKYDFELLR